jgi:hypothetical protein
MKLFAWGGWILGKNHPDFDVDSEGKYLKEWPPTQSSNLFKMPLPDAERKIQAELEKCLRQFKRNRYYKA